jgi:hypothetical protein
LHPDETLLCEALHIRVEIEHREESSKALRALHIDSRPVGHDRAMTVIDAAA